MVYLQDMYMYFYNLKLHKSVAKYGFLTVPSYIFFLTC